MCSSLTYEALLIGEEEFKEIIPNHLRKITQIIKQEQSRKGIKTFQKSNKNG